MTRRRPRRCARHVGRRAGLVGALAAIHAVPALSQNGPYPIAIESAPRPVAEASMAVGPIAVDGRLREASWGSAEPITNFIQSQPRPGYPATQATVVRILYDEEHLYVGAVCYDSEPDQLVITSLEHDFGAGSSTRDMDIFSITLDTFFDRRNSFIFLVSPGGAFRDGQTFNDSRQTDFAWRAIAKVRTTVHDSGYTVEMAIPWTTLRFDPTNPNQRWGMNMLRRVRRTNEDSYWAPLDRRDPVHRMSKAGTLEGLRGLRSGRNLQFKPFTLGSRVSGIEVPEEEEGFSGDAGLDAKWGVTAGLTLDGTFRTDFSQVEVDQEQVNLTRFPLFFPERRDFFVENSGSFVLGDVTERNYRSGSSLRDFTLFHSRRIGLTEGRPVPIVGGARLTGRAGPYELGLLTMQTEAFDAMPGENFGVVRLRRNVGATDFGAMFVNRQATGELAGGAYNRTFAADANLHLLDHLIVNTYAARTEDPDLSGNRNAARLALSWRDRIWDLSVFAKHVGDGFDPGVGFVRRRGVRHGYATVGAHPRPPARSIQEVNPYGELHYITDLAGELLTRRGVVAFGITFQDGASLDVQYQNRFERLIDPDEVGGVSIPPGDYNANDVSATYSTSPARGLSGRVTVTGGGFFDGRRLSVSANGLWRIHYRLSVDATASHNRVNLDGGSFNADVYGARMRFAYSTSLYSTGLLQYNRQTDELVANIRLNWIYAPLSDVFFVFTQRQSLSGSGRGVTDRAVTLKVTKLFAF